MRFVRVIVARTLRRDALQQRLLLRRNLVIPAEAAQLQTLRDTQRRLHEADRGSRLIARLHRIQKQIQPAAEMLRLDALEWWMRLLHIAAVLLRAQHKTAPERAHLGQVVVPTPRQRRLEHGAQQRIGAHAVVKAVDELANIRLSRFGGALDNRCGGKKGGHANSRKYRSSL